MAHVMVREVVSVPPWYTTANSAATLSSGSLSPAQAASAPPQHGLIIREHHVLRSAGHYTPEHLSSNPFCCRACLNYQHMLTENTVC